MDTIDKSEYPEGHPIHKMNTSNSPMFTGCLWLVIGIVVIVFICAIFGGGGSNSSKTTAGKSNAEINEGCPDYKQMAAIQTYVKYSLNDKSSYEEKSWKCDGARGNDIVIIHEFSGANEYGGKTRYRCAFFLDANDKVVSVEVLE